MQEKIKISKKELEDIYDIIPDIEKPQETETDKNFTFEEYTEHFDKENKKVEENAT